MIRTSIAPGAILLLLLLASALQAAELRGKVVSIADSETIALLA